MGILYGLYRGHFGIIYIRIMEKRSKLPLYSGYIGIMEKKMVVYRGLYRENGK